MASRKKTTKSKSKKQVQTQEKSFIWAEIGVIVLFLVSLLLFLSNFGIIGTVGDFIKGVQTGFFGVVGYIFPIILFMTVAFCLSNLGNNKVWLDVIAAAFVIISICTILSVFWDNAGGSLGDFTSDALIELVGELGTVLIMLAVLIISIVFVTGKSFVSAVKTGGQKAYKYAKEDAEIRKLEHTAKVAEKRQARKESALKRVSGIDFAATDLSRPIEETERPVEASAEYNDDFATPEDEIKPSDPDKFVGKIVKPEVYESEEIPFEEEKEVILAPSPIETATGKVIDSDEVATQKRMAEAKNNTELGQTRQLVETRKKAVRLKPYKIPPLNILTKGVGTNGTSDNEYKQTAIKLQQTLSTFGINVKVTDISCGPTVTRYELHPELGVRVANILALQDDIKLAIAAPSIRIEAPIPGKAAIGIEVPNKESNVVQLRDILESRDFKNSTAKIAFAIGKDIGGATLIADLAKMPHVLIAGATGSGKSVCINTLILSILYKYSPQDVKMIMIDPKMVELSGYNGIPHLLIPVVTDVKKATGALNWAVAEMEDRYKKFEAIGAKDIASYNEHIEAARKSLIANGQSTEDIPEKLPTIVIIVDELADMMMQCKSEVEPAIVRISQLARAAGMHLVIATQRPSVNVITGLIKANIPSRIALAVTSGVDSRTIIDTVGAERLLGHGDMLYNPQDAAKPIRAQGAYISESDIHKVVDYILNENITPDYDETTFSKMMVPKNDGGIGGANDKDELFAQAGRFIINKNKASIGNLQRAFRIGFTRAARIMDQLCEAGVVGPEQGTKPREILMSEEEFEELCSQI